MKIDKKDALKTGITMFAIFATKKLIEFAWEKSTKRNIPSVTHNKSSYLGVLAWSLAVSAVVSLERIFLDKFLIEKTKLG